MVTGKEGFGVCAQPVATNSSSEIKRPQRRKDAKTDAKQDKNGFGFDCEIVSRITGISPVFLMGSAPTD